MMVLMFLRLLLLLLVHTLYTNQLLIGLKGRLNADASLKISALRSATALQKYKEIQNSNDPEIGRAHV